MNKKNIFFVVIIIMLTSDSCGMLTQNTNESINQGQTSVDAVKAQLEELIDTNQNWYDQNGWYHYECTPSDGGIYTYRFYAQDRWTFIEDGSVKSDFHIVADSTTDAEIQRYIMDESGTRAELIELRSKGLKARQFAQPMPDMDWTVYDISNVWTDFRILEALEEFISVVELTEVPCNDTNCIKVRVEYIGDPELRILGLPPGEGKIGKVEEFIYETDTGLRVQYARGFINEDNQVDELNSFTEVTQYLEDLPEGIQNEFGLSEQELVFYNRLFND